MSRHRVAAVAVAGANTFELAVACEVFGLERPELGVEWYEFVVCSRDGGPLAHTGGMTISAAYRWDDLVVADTVIVPGTPHPHDRPDRRLVDAVRRAYDRGARIVSFCSGVFTLAAAGILEGRRATTHWMYVEELRRLHPGVIVEPDVLYVDAGQVLTSAGTAAGIDLSLHVVRCDHGAEVANAVARRMVVPPHRDGGQAQFVSPSMPAHPAPVGGLAETMDWMVAHLGEPLTVEAMADHALMSPRTFARHFRSATGATPHDWLTSRRVHHAQRLLESTDLPVERVAEASGLGTAANLRQHFQRLVGVAPSDYRRRFKLAS
jgi:AraC family transcriptional activator FtrA